MYKSFGEAIDTHGIYAIQGIEEIDDAIDQFLRINEKASVSIYPSSQGRIILRVSFTDVTLTNRVHQSYYINDLDVLLYIQLKKVSNKDHLLKFYLYTIKASKADRSPGMIRSGYNHSHIHTGADSVEKSVCFGQDTPLSSSERLLLRIFNGQNLRGFLFNLSSWVHYESEEGVPFIHQKVPKEREEGRSSDFFYPFEKKDLNLFFFWLNDKGKDYFSLFCSSDDLKKKLIKQHLEERMQVARFEKRDVIVKGLLRKIVGGVYYKLNSVIDETEEFTVENYMALLSESVPFPYKVKNGKISLGLPIQREKIKNEEQVVVSKSFIRSINEKITKYEKSKRIKIEAETKAIRNRKEQGESLPESPFYANGLIPLP